MWQTIEAVGSRRTADDGGGKPSPDVPRPKRPHARKIRQPLGPFETACVSFDKGTRAIEIVRLTPAAIVYRLKGRAEEYTITHGVAFMRAISAAAGFDSGPRDSTRVTRGTV